MKQMIIFAVAFIAVSVVSMKMFSSGRSIPPNYYCLYDDKTGECSPNAEGWACYGVNEDCSWMD